jgi:DNA-binding XRE family transcriptional regulator
MNNNVYKTLREKNMTSAELAQIVGIDQTSLHYIITRKLTPNVSLRTRIANALEVPMEYLFFRRHKL